MRLLSNILAPAALACGLLFEVQQSVALGAACEEELTKVPGKISGDRLNKLCEVSSKLKDCQSTKGADIYHFDFAEHSSKAQKILVFSVVHGDEPESGRIALRWAERLTKLKSRNRWRIVPILNPDGLTSRTRTNSRGVDLNRNFPSEDWQENALKLWDQKKNKDPRRYPGASPASEQETICAIRHIESFRPDFIISIHTPYGVLDFDGPKVAFPKFDHLPWVSLGTFPGSLGRYMWKDQNVPVLTIELKDESLLSRIDQVDLLQDISGTVAIRAKQRLQH